MPNTTHEEESEDFEEFKVEAVAGQKYVERQCMHLVKWKDWEKRWWVRAENMAECKELLDK